jgi:hypothetical protein
MLCLALVGHRPAGTPELSGGRETGGGQGVLIDENLYLLDLAISGSALDPYDSLDSGETLPDELNEVLTDTLQGVVTDPAILAVVESKLAQLKTRLATTKLPLPVDSIIRNMGRYAWSYHPGLPCDAVDDPDTGDLPYPNRVQLAYRSQSEIRFCDSFGSLDAKNAAALIVHEIVYAALAEKGKLLEFNGLLFHTQFKDFSPATQRLLAMYVRGFEDWRFSWGYQDVGSVGHVSPAVQVALGAEINEQVCFGSAQALMVSAAPDSEPSTRITLIGSQLWLTTSGSCSVTYDFTRKRLALPTIREDRFPSAEKPSLRYLSVYDPDSLSHYINVGLLDTATDTVEALCTGIFRGRCQIQHEASEDGLLIHLVVN